MSGEANQRFVDWLAKLSHESDNNGRIEIPEWIQSTNDRKAFKEFIYPRHELESGDRTIFQDRTILSSQNESVAMFNSEIAQVLTSESREYVAWDMVKNDQSGQIGVYSPENGQDVEVTNLLDRSIELHVGMPVILLHDYCPRQGLCKGTRLMVTRLLNSCVKARIMSQDPRFDGKEHMIIRVTVISSRKPPFTLTRKQLPIRACYSMTFNKAQGQTFKYVGVDLTNAVFSQGQFYLAMSRVHDVSRLVVLLPPSTNQSKHTAYQDMVLQPPVEEKEGRGNM